MGQFTFRLQTLMRVRQSRRDRHRVRLAEAVEVEQGVARRLEELALQRHALQVECREAAGPGILDLERLVERRQHERLVTEEIKQLEIQQAESARRSRRQSAVLVAAQRELRSLERLEQHQQAKYELQHKRQETRVLDEMASMVR